MSATQEAAPAAAEKPAEKPAVEKSGAAPLTAEAVGKAIPTEVAADYKLTAPAGFDDAYVAGLVDFAKKNGVSPQAAQAWLEREGGLRAESEKTRAEQETAMAQGWLGELRKTHTNERLVELKATIGAFLDRNASATVIRMLTEGNAPPILQPEVFAFLAKVAEGGREGVIVKAGEPTRPAAQSARERFAKTYADMTPAQRAANGFE